MPDDLNSRLPAALVITFPLAAHMGPDAPRVAYEVTLASLALQGAPGVTGYPGTVLLRSSAVAGPGTPPANDAELLALARQVATDWYGFAVAAMDRARAGVAAWDPEGVTDWLEVRQTPDGRMLTRAFSDSPDRRADLFHFSSRGAADDAPASAVLAVTEGDRSPEGYYPAELLVWDAVALRFGAVPGVAPVWLALSDVAFAPGAGSGSGSGSGVGGGPGAPVPLPDAGAAVLFPGDLRVATPSAARPGDGRTVYVALPRVFWALLTGRSGSAYSWRPLRAAASGLAWEQGTDGPADAYPANGSLDYPTGEYPDGAVVRMTLDGDHLTFEDLAVFGPAGSGHSQGAVPDPGPGPHTPPYYLGDDAGWHPFPGGSGPPFADAVPLDVVVNACLGADEFGGLALVLERRTVWVADFGAPWCADADSPCCGEDHPPSGSGGPPPGSGSGGSPPEFGPEPYPPPDPVDPYGGACCGHDLPGTVYATVSNPVGPKPAAPWTEAFAGILPLTVPLYYQKLGTGAWHNYVRHGGYYFILEWACNTSFPCYAVNVDGQTEADVAANGVESYYHANVNVNELLHNGGAEDPRLYCTPVDQLYTGTNSTPFDSLDVHVTE